MNIEIYKLKKEKNNTLFNWNYLILKPNHKKSNYWKTVIYDINTKLIIVINLEDNKTNIRVEKNFHNLFYQTLDDYTGYSLEINDNILNGLNSKDKTILNLTIYSLLMNKNKKKINIKGYKNKYQKLS